MTNIDNCNLSNCSKNYLWVGSIWIGFLSHNFCVFLHKDQHPFLFPCADISCGWFGLLVLFNIDSNKTAMERGREREICSESTMCYSKESERKYDWKSPCIALWPRKWSQYEYEPFSCKESPTYQKKQRHVWNMKYWWLIAMNTSYQDCSSQAAQKFMCGWDPIWIEFLSHKVCASLRYKVPRQNAASLLIFPV